MKTILSTKKLSIAQKELLLNSGNSLIEYNAIEIELLPFELPSDAKNAIFTSQNAVLSYLKNRGENHRFKNIFCVGQKTRSLLEENGQKVTKTEENASNLAHFIAKTHQNDTFFFLCGNLKLDDIGNILISSKNDVFELKTYKTELKSRVFKQKWGGIMFFSPSGVRSYTSENKMGESIAICIGETTASEAKKHSDKVYTANNTSIESVIAKTIKILNNK